MIKYTELARVRRELENILLLIDELDQRGIPKDVIVDKIIDEKPSSKNESLRENK